MKQFNIFGSIDHIDYIKESDNFKINRMFNKDFYPTPVEVIQTMVQGLELKGKVLYDPESGKGDIMKLGKLRGATVIGSEINPDLYAISSKYGKMIGTDFLDIRREDISHVDYIVMNPPFSADIKHIKHAWDIAPDGCEIRALCNNDTLSRDIRSVKHLKHIIKENRGAVEGIGQVFVDAERKTRVKVALVILTKPEKEEEDWSEYFEYNMPAGFQQDGLMKADAITEIVGRYVGALRMFRGVEKVSSEINEMMGPINKRGGISFGCTRRNDRGNTDHLGYKDFEKELQKSAWRMVFDKMNMKKYMTEKLKEKINKFVEEQIETPFTVQNIYNMLQFVHDTNASRMNEVLIEVFDTFTSHYHENRYNVEGWKTNSHYMINQKIIVPYVVNISYGKMDIGWGGNSTKVDDLVKALCYITGQDYGKMGDLNGWCNRTRIMDPEYYLNSEEVRRSAERRYKHYSEDWRIKEKFIKMNPDKEKFIEECINDASKECKDYYKREFGKWYDWGFFEIKGFKKGTMHFKFKDKGVWELFNVRVGEIKGFDLPEAFGKEAKEEYSHVPGNQLLLN